MAPDRIVSVFSESKFNFFREMCEVVKKINMSLKFECDDMNKASYSTNCCPIGYSVLRISFITLNS